MNKESNKEVHIKVRLSEEENEELKRCAGACGMSQSEFIRQLCKGKTPKLKPTKEFWELLNPLYSVHNGFQKCVFEPFAQEHTGSRTKFAGTGLGMPIAKNLVEKMGGTITFESKECVGTTFVIRIPFKIDLDADKREEQKDVSEKSIKGLHILLAEDNELNMEIAEFVIQNEGASVTKAWNGQEAVEIFKKSRPDEFDVILMDIMMPIKNGYEAAKMIRALDRDDAKTVPIIAMTANAFTEDRLKSKESGMNEHIAKPIDAKLLVKVISEFVENKEEDS